MWTILRKSCGRKGEGDLADRSYNSVNMWAQEVRLALHMQCSDKNVIIPEGMLANIVQRALLEEGVKVNIMNHGVDVGTWQWEKGQPR